MRLVLFALMLAAPAFAQDRFMDRWDRAQARMERQLALKEAKMARRDIVIARQEAAQYRAEARRGAASGDGGPGGSATLPPGTAPRFAPQPALRPARHDRHEAHFLALGGPVDRIASYHCIYETRG